MRLQDKTKNELLNELERLRRRVAELEFVEARHQLVAEALRQSEEMVRALLDSNTDAALLMSADGALLSLNEIAAQKFGQPSARLVGRNIFDLLPDGSAADRRRRILEVVRSGCPVRFVDSAEGVFTENRVHPVFDASGKTARLAVFSRDITPQVQAEMDLRLAKETAESADAAKSRFLAAMSHELRTPLNSIIGFSEVLEDQFYGELNKKQLEFAALIGSSGHHLLNLINDILDLAKVESGKSELHMSRVNIGALLHTTLSMIEEKATRSRLALHLCVGSDLEDANILADELKLRQIVLNLLSNAAKFTPDGGSIQLQAVRQENELIIGVADSGIGVKPEDQKRIFDPFEQVDSSLSRKQGGTGLGLALSRTLAELHGGRIWVESEGEGKGCTFSVAIPFVQMGDPYEGVSLRYTRKVAESTSPDFEVKAEQDSQRRVLVVEDDEAGMKLVTNVLEEGGYTVVQAWTAEEAIRIANLELPALILMDISLPGMDGLAATRILKRDKRTRPLPVVALTAHAMRGDEAAAFEAGCDAYLTKPIDRGRLFETLRSFVR